MEQNNLELEIKQLRSVIEQQQAALAILQKQINQLSDSPPKMVQPTSRRQLLKKLALGTLAVTATTSALTLNPSNVQASTHGSNRVYGYSAVPDDGRTSAYLPTSGSYGVIGQAGEAATEFGTSGDVFCGVLGQGPYGVLGIGSRNNSSNIATGVEGHGQIGVRGEGSEIGVQASSFRGDAITAVSRGTYHAAVYAQNGAAGVCYGVNAFCDSREGVAVAGGSANGTGIRGWTSGGGGGQAGIFGINAATSGSGFGVYGLANHAESAGVGGRNDNGEAVSGYSVNGLGGRFYGGKANLALTPHNTTGSPTDSLHQAGEVYVDVSANIYFCVGAGTPGIWRQVYLY